MNKAHSNRIQPAWISKSLAGMILGFTFAIGCSGLFMQLATDAAMSARVQLAMWLTIPIWLTVLGACFAFRTGRKAWITLLVLNLLVFSIALL